MSKSKVALLIGTEHQLMYLVPSLLVRAGFYCDTITTFEVASLKKYIRNSFVVNGSIDQIITLAFSAIDKSYDLVVICDDLLLKLISISNYPDEKKIQLLPINSLDKKGHLFSKIGLAKALANTKILTPNFEIAKSSGELAAACKKIGFPLLIKKDSSGGGLGVVEIGSLTDLLETPAQNWDFPLLIQKKIIGPVVDCSGFYQNGKLIHFSFSYFLECISHKFSISKERLYLQRATLDKKVWDELNELGELLGLDGFVNISCIQSKKDQCRYYFEADVRPNVWVDYGKYFGDDPAIAIKRFFETKKYVTFNNISLDTNFPKSMTIPYFFRLNAWEILTNRHRAWCYLDGFSIMSVIKYVKKIYISDSVSFIEKWVHTLKYKLSFIFLFKSSLLMYQKNLRGIKHINWSFAESWGRWTDNTPAILIWNTDLPKQFNVILHIVSSYERNAGKLISIQIGDQVKNFTAPANIGLVKLNFFGVKKGVREIIINIPHPISPSSLGQSIDDRQLGVGLNKIVIEAL